MDDDNSRKQIDELADLYLTGVIDDSVNAQDDQGDQADEPRPIDGPAPIRLSPKLGDGGAASTGESSQNDVDPSAEPDDRHPVLRLTEGENEDPSVTDQAEQSDAAVATDSTQQRPTADRSEPAPQAMLEATLLGNLPGMSGPWLTQYAQLIAQSEGPVALLHIGDSAIDLELIEPRAEAEPAPAASTTTVRIPPMRGNKTGLVGLLDALTRSDTAPTRTILVRIDQTDDPQTLPRLAAIEDWTLLCGSDDASVAAAAQQLRSMVQADPRLADRNVGLMVMGSDEPAARDAAGRVAREVDQDLLNRVEFIGHLKRMQPVQVRELGSFPDPVGIWPQLVSWFDTLESPASEPILESVMPQPVNPQPSPTTPPRETPARENPFTPEASAARPQRLSPAATKLGAPASRPEPRPAFTPTPTVTPPRSPRPPAQRHAASTPPPTRAQPANRTDHRATPTTPAPAPSASPPTRPAPQPRVLAPQPELDLIALLAQGPAALNDPAILEARIPDQPETQLAVDAQGVVHILLKKVSDTIIDGDATSTDPRQAVMQLIEAGRWVREHLELLALTQRDRDFIDLEPTLHLLTDRADLTTHLVGKLAGQVKLHLLQQVKLGRESGWFCTPLG